MIKAISSNIFFRKLYFDKSEIDRILIVSTAFSIVLVLFRFLYTGELLFFFMPWNLFLAWVPYSITKLLTARPQWMENKLKFAMIFLAWLVFVPNSFYIITDLFHLNRSNKAPQWYDLAVIFSFAWNGLLLGVLSIRQMEKIIRILFTKLTGLLFILPIMWLNALGIYLGRYLRFNSWEILTNPFELAYDIVYLCVHPLRNLQEWGMICCYTLLMSIIYISIKKISRVVW